MDNYVKYILVFFSAIAIIGIIVAFSLSKNRDPLEKYRQQFIEITTEENNDLPMKIGTLGTLDSITFRDNTLFYNMTVFGSDSVHEIYREYSVEHNDMIKYNLLLMNGQFHNGDKFCEIIKALSINIGIVIYTANKSFSKFVVSYDELEAFRDSCRVNPTEALGRVIDVNLAMANVSLPGATLEDASLRTISINTMLADSEDGCLLMHFEHSGDSIIMEYMVDESKFPIDNIINVSTNDEYLNMVAKDISTDPDMLEFIRLVVISHSSLTCRYIGMETNKDVSVTIPYMSPLEKVAFLS